MKRQLELLKELQDIENSFTTGKKPKNTSISSLEKRKQKIEETVELRFLRYYKRIREKYDDAIVSAKSGGCPACGMQIPPIVLQEIRREIGFNHCATCGRILVWK